MHAHKRVVIICNKLVRLGQSYVFIMTVDTIGELVSIIQTYRPWTPRRTSGRIVNKKFDAKARLTEISVNDLIGHWQ